MIWTRSFIGAALMCMLVAAPLLSSALPAQAAPAVDCSSTSLHGVRAITRIEVRSSRQSYPTIVSTTEYRIPLAWPGLVALLNEDDPDHDSALRCFLVQRDPQALDLRGESRDQPPRVRVDPHVQPELGLNVSNCLPTDPPKDPPPKTPAKFSALTDTVSGTITNGGRLPYLGPWAANLRGNDLELRILDPRIEQAEYASSSAPGLAAADWTLTATVEGLALKGFQPTPLITDGASHACWAGTTAQLLARSPNIALGLPVAESIAISTARGPSLALSQCPGPPQVVHSSPSCWCLFEAGLLA